MYKTMLKYRDEIARLVERDRSRLLSFPQDNLKCKRDRKYVKWYAVNEDGKRKYIKKSEREKARILAEKLLIETRLQANVAELKAVDSYLAQSADSIDEIDKLVSTESMYKELLAGKHIPSKLMLEEWKTAEYETNEGYKESANYYSPTGNIVRSKSEMMIDMFLADKGVAYRYEDRLELKDGTFIYPDFTFLFPDGKKKYWEHCGMMASPDYIEAFKKKLSVYADNGIYLNERLFVTFETSAAPLQISDIETTYEKIMR